MQLYLDEKSHPKLAFGIACESGEIRARDQRIKRSRASSKAYVAYGFERPKNECAFAFLVHSSKSRFYIKSRVIVDRSQ